MILGLIKWCIDEVWKYVVFFGLGWLKEMLDCICCICLDFVKVDYFVDFIVSLNYL